MAELTAEQVEERVRGKIAAERERAVDDLARAKALIADAERVYADRTADEQAAWGDGDPPGDGWQEASDALARAAHGRLAVHDRIAQLERLIQTLDDPETARARIARRLEQEQRFAPLRNRNNGNHDKEENVKKTSTSTKKGPGPKEAEARQQREQKAEAVHAGNEVEVGAEAAPETGKTDGGKTDAGALMKALLGKLRSAKAGKVVAHEKGLYARLMDGKRTVGYVVPRKKGLRVYPNALADAMPDGLSFTKVELGAHHYGRGEVILDVAGEDDFADAVKALEAAAANPIPRKEKAPAAA